MYIGEWKAMNKEKKNKKLPFNTLRKGVVAGLLGVTLGVSAMGLTGCSLGGEDGKNGTQWLSGTNAPVASQGVDGDFYLDIDDYKLYQKENGQWVLKVENFGKPGSNGTNGTNGSNGIAPTIEINDDGYWVINGVATDVKARGEDGEDGEDGKDGTTPIISISSDGYWIINGTTTQTKAEAIDGTNGEDGSMWTVGTTYPDSPKMGDIFLNTTTWDIYQYNGTSWDSKGSIKGSDGEKGEDGESATVAIDTDGYWIINGQKTEYQANSSADVQEVMRFLESVAQKGNLNQWNLLDKVTPTLGYYDAANNIINENLKSFYVWQYIPVEDLDLTGTINFYSFSGSSGDPVSQSMLRSIGFFDENKEKIDVKSYPSQTYSVSTTKKICYITACVSTELFNNGYLTIEGDPSKRVDSYEYVINIDKISELNDKLNALQSEIDKTKTDIKQEQSAIDSIMYQDRKATFSFTFDDNLESHYTNVIPLFDEYDIRCGFGLIATDGFGSTDLCREMLKAQERGYEILSHSINGTAFSTIDDATAEQYLKNSKDILTSLGFNINGFITPSSWSNGSQQELIEKYYSYGLGHNSGISSGANEYHLYNNTGYAYPSYMSQLDRWSIESHTLEETKAMIDKCIADGGYMCFYAHSYPSTETSKYLTEENLRAIIKYLKEKQGDGECEIKTPSEAIKYYYTPRVNEDNVIVDETTAEINVRLNGNAFNTPEFKILNGREYRFLSDDITKLRILPPAGNVTFTQLLGNDGEFECKFVIKNTGSSAFTFIDSTNGELKMVGDDCIDGIFTPKASTSYEITFRWNGVKMIGTVMAL